VAKPVTDAPEVYHPVFIGVLCQVYEAILHVLADHGGHFDRSGHAIFYAICQRNFCCKTQLQMNYLFLSVSHNMRDQDQQTCRSYCIGHAYRLLFSSISFSVIYLVSQKAKKRQDAADNAGVGD
jgi:hypothetical protein